RDGLFEDSYDDLPGGPAGAGPPAGAGATAGAVAPPGAGPDGAGLPAGDGGPTGAVAPPRAGAPDGAGPPPGPSALAGAVGPPTPRPGAPAGAVPPPGAPGDAPGRPPRPLTSTFAPCRSLAWPSVTTLSPASSPLLMIDSLPCVLATTIWRVSTVESLFTTKT